MTNQDINTRINEEFDAMQSPAAWNAHSKRQLQPVLGQLDYSKSEKFAEYLNKRFMDAAMANNAVEMNIKWDTLSRGDKIAFAQKITNTLIELLYGDIRSNRVKTYNTSSGEEYTPTDEFFDAIYKDDIKQYIDTQVKINVTESNSGLMSLSHNKKLNINLDWPLYADMTNFLMDLRHELMHMVDIFIPQISTLSPKTRKTSMRYYISGRNGNDFEYYQNNPLEINANLKRREFRTLCLARLAAATIEYARAKALTRTRA